MYFNKKAMTSIYYDDSDDEYDENVAYTIQDARSHTLRFGKFKNQTLGSVCKAAKGRSWLKWALSNCAILSRLDEALIRMLLEDYRAYKLDARRKRLASKQKKASDDK